MKPQFFVLLMLAVQVSDISGFSWDGRSLGLDAVRTKEFKDPYECIARVLYDPESILRINQMSVSSENDCVARFRHSYLFNIKDNPQGTNPIFSTNETQNLTMANFSDSGKEFF
jgi:hypothetical protein